MDRSHKTEYKVVIRIRVFLLCYLDSLYVIHHE